MSKLWVGTYTDQSSEGIYYVEVNKEQTDYEVELKAKVLSPVYFCYAHKKPVLYAVSEPTDGITRGKVNAYLVDGTNLKLLNEVQAPSDGLVHVACDSDDRFLFTVSYRDGTVQSYRLKEDGSVGELACQIIHNGSGPNTNRQDCAHAHGMFLTPNETIGYVCDLGMDKVVAYQIDYNTGQLIEDCQKSIQLTPGSGPRHLEFSKCGKYILVLCELSSSVAVYDVASSKLINQYSTIKNTDCESIAAAIRMTQDGKYLYISNRGEDSIAVFRIKEAELMLIQHIDVMGKHPRDFILSKDESMLYAACQDTNNVTIFARNKEDGQLTFVKEIIGINRAVTLIEIE